MALEKLGIFANAWELKPAHTVTAAVCAAASEIDLLYNMHAMAHGMPHAS